MHTLAVAILVPGRAAAARKTLLEVGMTDSRRGRRRGKAGMGFFLNSAAMGAFSIAATGRAAGVAD